MEISYNPRTKINVKPKSYNQAPAWIKKARTSSFFCEGPRFNNSMTAGLHVEIFERQVDSYLKDIPDIPGTLANSLCQNLAIVVVLNFPTAHIYF